MYGRKVMQEIYDIVVLMVRLGACSLGTLNSLKGNQGINSVVPGNV